MTPWRNPWHWDGSLQSLRELQAPHGDGPGRGYNVLFGDGHVVLVKRQDYLFPPRTARNWNRDNRPHEEAWAPVGEWEVKQ